MTAASRPLHAAFTADLRDAAGSVGHDALWKTPHGGRAAQYLSRSLTKNKTIVQYVRGAVFGGENERVEGRADGGVKIERAVG